MNIRSLLVLGIAIGAQCANTCCCSAAGPNRSIEFILTKWGEASYKRHTLDTRLTLLSFSGTSAEEKPTIQQGRFYYEAPNVGRFELGTPSSGKKGVWAGFSQVWVWNGKETLQIIPSERLCRRVAQNRVRPIIDEENPEDFWPFVRGKLRQCECPQEFLPLVVGIDSTGLRKRFDWNSVRNGKDIVLTALPKSNIEKAFYRKLTVTLLAETYITLKTEVVTSFDRTICVLGEQKINEKPKDRNELIVPDLSLFRIVEVDDSIGKRSRPEPNNGS